MKNKVISALLSGALFITTLTPISASAETTYATVNDFIEDVMKIATSNITSTTKEEAIDNVVNNITITGDEVFYEGNSIGYWYSDDSDTLYSDLGKTSTLIDNNGTGYIVDSALLSDFLTDINGELVEKYEPTSTDWSKIIGKYDVTLGNTTIPVDNWVDITDVTNSNYINISRITGVTIKKGSTTWIMAFSWLVDENGELYISSGIEGVGSTIDRYSKIGIIKHTSGSTYGDIASSFSILNSSQGIYCDNGYHWITLDASTTASVIDPTFSISKDATLNDKQTGRADDESFNTFRNINDPSLVYTGTIDEAKSCGIAYYTLNGLTAYDDSSELVFMNNHNNFWTTFEASQTVTGNTLLTKRLSKISNLNSTDTLTISSNGWEINGIDVDTFLGTQENTVAGGATDMGVNIEVETKNFKAVLPTTLPVFVNRDGTIVTATNAAIKNESNDDIIITDLEINARPGGDWTLVNTTPSQEASAKEFSFSTSLNIGNVINKDAELSFTYTAAFSPSIYDCENLDAATVTVTLDWAD